MFRNFLLDKKFYLLALIAIGLVYALFANDISKNIFSNSNFPYYTYLIDGLIHGRLNIISPTTIDLSIFNNKLYLNWGPSPILFILPFYLLSGGRAGDIFYTLSAGIGNVVLFFLLLNEAQVYFKIKLSRFLSAFLLLTFAFCSPNFYLSLGGRIWATEQIISTFYILVFLLFYFKYLNSGLSATKHIFIALLFFNLAWFARATMVFYAALLLYVIYLIFKKRRKELSKAIFMMLSITFLFGLIFFTYNYLRFNNIFETGLTYHNGNPRYVQILAEKKIFSPSYISFNFQHYFLEPAYLTIDKPYVNVDFEGNSIFSVYPVFIFLLFLFTSKYLKDKKINKFFYFAFLVIAIDLALLMLYFATGWTQVGSRYVFDIIPLVSLLSIFVVKNFPKPILLILLFNAALINVLGAIIFYSF